MKVGTLVSADARAVWLSMRGKGWWTDRGLVHLWHPTYAQYEMEALLRELRAGHHVESRLDRNGAVTFCVTSDCVVLS